AVRTPLGQRCLVALVDGTGRRGPVGVVAVRVAGLAARPLGVGLGWSLAERSRLPLGGANGLLEQPGQFGDPGLEFGHTRGQIPTPGTGRLVHNDIVAARGLNRSAAPEKALNKYTSASFAFPFIASPTPTKTLPIPIR